MARNREDTQRSGKTVLVIDDNEEYLEASRRLIERDGHSALTARSAADGLVILRERDVDLVLVDYLMPGLTGEEFVREMRTFRPTTQVVLQTGYASEHPPRELLKRMDIQGYHDKSDGHEKLSLWIDVGLKAAYTVQLLVQSRLGLRYVLDATPALHRIQPLQDLLQGILLQTAGLLGSANSFLAAVPMPDDAREDQGFLAMTQDEGGLRLRAATGRFHSEATMEDSLDPPRLASVMAALETGGITTLENGTVAPLRVGTRTLGLVYLDRAVREAWETEIVEVFANQAAVAIHNVALYEMAALDPLTGVATRRFFDKSVLRELRAASRSELPIGMLVIDIDRMKGLNDGYGHAVGDRALSAVGACLRSATRSTDVVGRTGGDEFAVLLPGTDAPGTSLVEQRVKHALAQLTVDHEGTAVDVRASVGAACLDSSNMKSTTQPGHLAPFIEAMRLRLTAAADAGMYVDKRAPAESHVVTMVSWRELAGVAEPVVSA